MKSHQILKVLCALILLVVTTKGGEAKRLALIVGNDAYQHVTPLKKAVNDAVAIESTLKDLGFETHSYKNLARRAMNGALADFTSQIEKNDEVLFFFSGHGIAIRGENYLLPVDVPSVVPGQESFITREAFREDDIIHALKDAGARVSILILDACRNNPFPRQGTRSLGRSVGLGRTIAPPEGTFVMYSAGVGQEALDRLSDDDPHPNSVYTRKLIPLLKVKGLQIVRVAKQLRSEVEALAKTAKAGPHKQYPSYYDELRGDFYFRPGQQEKTPVKISADAALWKTIETSNKISDFEFYLKEFPSGQFSAIAKLRINQLNASSKTESPVKEKPKEKTTETTADDLYWSIIKQSSRLSDYADYLLKFPSGNHKTEALAKIETLKKLALLTGPKEGQPKKETKNTRTYKAGETFIDCDQCPEMVVIPSGNFIMGEKAKPGDRFKITEPKHKVTIAKPFAIGKFEISREEYESFIVATGHDFGNLCWTVENNLGKYRKNRSYRVTGMARVDNYPTICVNWLDTKAYIRWLNKKVKKSGKTATYRLPTEAEWEYVARAGRVTKYDDGNTTKRLCDYGNFAARETPYKWKVKHCTDRHKKLAPVGTYKANLWGVHDMRGNAQEWVEDCAHYNYKNAPTDGSAWLAANRGACSQRILRGGGWTNGPESLTSGARHYTKTTDRTVTYGFRVVKDLE